eukprot:1707645-Pyramimonas_sp.AAC.1
MGPPVPVTARVHKTPQRPGPSGVVPPDDTVLEGLSEAARNETKVASSESLARLARLRGFLVLSRARLFGALACEAFRQQPCCPCD